MEKARCWLYVSKGVADGLLDMAFDPAISDRFPKTDHKDFQLPEIMHHFCFPHGIRFVKAGEQEIPMPRWSMFVLTQGDGTRVYGACVTFYEVMTPQEIGLLEEQYVSTHIRLISQCTHIINITGTEVTTNSTAKEVMMMMTTRSQQLS